MKLAALEQILDRLEKNGTIVLVSVLTRTGSTPAPLNASLVVDSASTWGTIGGGMLEAAALSKAQDMLDSGGAAILSVSMTNESASEDGMLCGGSVSLLLEVLQPPDLSCWGEAVEAAGNSLRGLFVVRIEEKEPGHVSASRQWVGSDSIEECRALRTHAEQAIDRGIPRTAIHGEARYFLDPLVLPDQLLVFGAGHVARALVPIATSLGFRCWVIDDRSDFASRERFPQAHKLVVGLPAESVDSLPAGKNVWAVVMTRGHKGDAEVLLQLLTKTYQYVGMIGSLRKKEVTFRDLQRQGIPPEVLALVHCPIGLPLGGTSPAEIAVSIASELIAVRYGNRIEHDQ